MQNSLLNPQVSVGDEVAVGFFGNAARPVRGGQGARGDSERRYGDGQVAVEMVAVGNRGAQLLYLFRGGPGVVEDGGEFAEQVWWRCGGLQHERRRFGAACLR
jgi:hypothetical protein